MTTGPTVFDTLSLDRRLVRWEDYLDCLTPITGGRIRYKREDAFAPLGYGGINGSKLRQLIWLISRSNAPRVITAASVHSPQISMTALVAAHFERPCDVLMGGTKPETAIRHENVAIAAASGAEFHYAPVGYNPTLQKALGTLRQEAPYRSAYQVNYGITTPGDATDAEIEAFHRLGAHQVANLPPDVRTLVMTAGSGNSFTSVLYGLALNIGNLPNLERIVLMGIGPVKLDFGWKRLARIENTWPLPLRSLFRPDYPDHPVMEEQHRAITAPDAPWSLHYIDLHARRYCAYADKKPFRADGINFHPTYEGKALTWLHEMGPDRASFFFEDPDSILFWIVGSAPTLTAMRATLNAVDKRLYGRRPT